MDRALEELAPATQTSDQTIIEHTHNLEFDICRTRYIVDKVRESKVYAQNLYAALCNNEFQEQHVFEILKDKTWSCTWRYAGGIIADIRSEGDYLDWYCSGTFTSHPDHDLDIRHFIETGYVGEGMITDEILTDLAKIGWHPVG